jgi:hypothetical protein
MATSTLIQRLDSTALVPSSTVPGGYDVVATPMYQTEDRSKPS